MRLQNRRRWNTRTSARPRRGCAAARRAIREVQTNAYIQQPFSSVGVHMKKVIGLLALGAVFAALVAAAPAPRERVVLAGGCFWGMQAVFEQVRGVTRVVAGYSGGSKD